MMKTEKTTFINKFIRKKSSILVFFIFISLIVHACLFILFLRFGFQKRIISLLQAIQQELTPKQRMEFHKKAMQRRQAILKSLRALKSNRPAKLTAPLSPLGWVFFDDSAKKIAEKNYKKKTQIPTTTDGLVGQADYPFATEGNRVGKSETKLQHPKTPQLKSKPKIIAPPKKANKPITTITKTPKVEIKKQVQTTIQKDGDQNIKESIKSPGVPLTTIEIKPQKPVEPSLPHSNSDVVKMIGGADGIRLRGAQSKRSQPKRNIIALTKGFIEKLEGKDGTDLIDRKGDPNKKPSFEELKYLSYESKISWSLQASWKQNFCYKPITKIFKGDAIISFTLDENGKLTEYELLQSTGQKELDNMIIESMKIASPFPPLPKHFGIKTYTTSRTIHVITN